MEKTRYVLFYIGENGREENEHEQHRQPEAEAARMREKMEGAASKMAEGVGGAVHRQHVEEFVDDVREKGHRHNGKEHLEEKRVELQVSGAGDEKNQEPVAYPIGKNDGEINELGAEAGDEDSGASGVAKVSCGTVADRIH